MNFEPSRVDQYIWIKMSTNPRGKKYREWIMVYVDDLIEISEEPKSTMNYLVCMI